MQLHFNDLSLCGQFATPDSFRTAIQPVLEFRRHHSRLGQRLYCSRSLSQRPATPQHTVQQAVLATDDRNFKGLILRWLGAGPFWDDEREENPDDYFHYEGEDVTLQGLGEAARRRIHLIDAGCFSLTEGTDRYARTPLNVNHGLEEDPLGVIAVPGFWNSAELPAILSQVSDSWRSLVAEADARFNLLWLHPDILHPLEKIPFDSVIAERVMSLFSVLQSIAAEKNTDGSLTEYGVQIWQQYSVGDSAWFTDESDQNKIDFSRVLEFCDPEYGGKISASWHGKIKHLQFRVHFEWPMRIDRTQIRIFYLGPKLTKR